MKKILKYIGLSISIIMLAVSVVFIALLINVRVVPVKYCVIAAVVLVILTAVTAFTQKWFVPGIITKIIAIIMIVVLIMGSIYLNQTRHMINQITTTQEEKIVMGVYVLNDSGYDSVDMLNNKSIGIGTTSDRESTDELIKKVPSGWIWMYLAIAVVLPFVLSLKIFGVPLTFLKNSEHIMLTGINRVAVNLYKWKESTLTVLPVLEFVTIVLMLIYYGEDVGIL